MSGAPTRTARSTLSQTYFTAASAASGSEAVEVTLLREAAAQRGAGEPVLLHQRQQPLCVQRIGLRGELNAVVSAVLQSAEGLLYVLVSDYPLGHAVLIHRRSPLSVRVEDDLERLAGAHGLQAFAELRQRQPVGYELSTGMSPEFSILTVGFMEKWPL